MAGAPVGNRNAAKAKLWAAAIERALEKRGGGDKIKALNELAEKLLVNCDSGDMVALKELGDRLDGKPAQSIVGEEESPLRIIQRIERVIVDPK
jgi:hypothetical protein